MGVAVAVGEAVAVAVGVGENVQQVFVGEAQTPPVSLCVPSNSADSARFVVVVPTPLKTTTALPGGFGLPSSRSMVIGPVLHSFPTTWRLSWDRTPPVGALYEESSGTAFAGLSGETAKSSVPL